MGSPFFHAHAHSQYSVIDGMSAVGVLVQAAKEHGQPALALTDHGNMGGIVKLYRGCREAGILPFPGVEGYLIDPSVDNWEKPEKGVKVGRYHYCLLALSTRGYQGLVKYVSMTHTRPRFSRFPRATLNDLVTFGEEYGDDVALLTGCYFGLLQQRLVNDGPDAAKRVLQVYGRSFPHTFVEVQNHHIDHPTGHKDMDLVKLSFELAHEVGLPVIATQDSHYHQQRHKAAHALMKRMVYRGDADDEFPGDSFHLATTEWMEDHYEPHQWEEMLDSFQELLDLNEVSIPPLDTYRIDVPKVTDKPFKHIATKAWDRLVELGLDDDDRYMERFEEELRVIKALKMASYFVIVERFVDWCQQQSIFIEARGSANGSLVLYLLGVTQVDPIQWGTQFDRFLSEDRIKPPDVDIDIRDDRRGEALEYFRRQYGATQIGTWSQLGTFLDDEGHEKGSVLQTWKQGKRAELEKWALAVMERENDKRDVTGEKHMTKYEAQELAKGTFYKKYEPITDVRQVQDVSPTDYRGLRQMLAMNSVLRSYGVHAGGVLLSGEHVKVEDWIPTMLVASSGTIATQYDMDDVELFGLLKMDVLGQSSLRVMQLTLENAGYDDPTDFSWIEPDDPDACKILRSGRANNGVFHYEGYAKAKGGRVMGIRSTMDAVLGSALFMPGAMNTGQTEHYLMCRKSARARQEVTYLHPIFERVLKETHGAVIFQEQVINIMRGLGMDIAGINKFFKVVKDSGKGAAARNADRLAEIRAQFDQLCEGHGIDPDEAWEQTAGFVAYGFNRAHATGYGVRSYRFAYLKAHYPTEFMAALLVTWAGRGKVGKQKESKEDLYVREARRMGIRILPADVNISGASWTIDPDGVSIRRGLVSVDGVGDKTALEIAKYQPFDSMEDMIHRVPKRAMTGGDKYLTDGVFTGILGKLHSAGALESLR